MRIVSGKYGGMQIHPPSGLPSRPTTDMAKVALFNILANYFDFENIKVLDLFAGTGNITFEFISRGVNKITSVDMHFKCIQFIKTQSAILKAPKANVIKSDVFSYVNKCEERFDIIFADPPYDLEKTLELPDMVFNKNLLNADGWLVVEHGARISFALHKNFSEHRKYGNVNFSIFKHQATNNQ